MKGLKLVPLVAALSVAFVIPDEHVLSQVDIESRPKDSKFSPSWIKDKFTNAVNGAVDSLVDYAEDEVAGAESLFRELKKAHEHDLEIVTEKINEGEDAAVDVLHTLSRQSHKWLKDLDLPIAKCPHRAEEEATTESQEGDEHHGGPPHKNRGHHKPPHHHKPNHTVYELIKKSKYTTRLAKAVDQFPDIVKALNSTKSDITLFAPTDKAFDKIPKHAHIPKKLLAKILKYHVVPDVYPARKVLGSRTLPTLLQGKGLSHEPEKTPQRLSINLSLRGLLLNYYSRIVAVNIPATNGIIHGVDSIILPYPNAAEVVDFFVGSLSTLDLALRKTDLMDALNDTSSRRGGTLFTPTNKAFERLGARANGFLFSHYGLKYLKALIEYHVVSDTTLYSDALFFSKKGGSDDSVREQRTFHIDLPTLLEDKSLSIDVAKWGRLVDIRINGFYHVEATDLPTEDGVMHFLGHVLIPPKTPGGRTEAASENIDVDELRERLEPYVNHEDTDMGNYSEWEMPLEL